MIGTVVVLLVYSFGWAKSRFRGPRVMGRDEEPADLEPEFEGAAEELKGPSPT